MEEVRTVFNKTLILTEEEAEAISVWIEGENDATDHLKFSLVGKVMTEEPFHREAFKQTMLKIWNTSREVIVKF